MTLFWLCYYFYTQTRVLIPFPINIRTVAQKEHVPHYADSAAYYQTSYALVLELLDLQSPPLGKVKPRVTHSIA